MLAPSVSFTSLTPMYPLASRNQDYRFSLGFRLLTFDVDVPNQNDLVDQEQSEFTCADVMRALFSLMVECEVINPNFDGPCSIHSVPSLVDLFPLRISMRNLHGFPCRLPR